MHPGALHLIDTLDLVPHPEGGFYRETFRSTAILSDLPSGPRAALTAIYFLLPAGTFSAWHRITSDELWCHYDGDPLELHTLTATGAHDVVLLGRNYLAGQRPQHAVPAGVLQAAMPVGDRWALAGCIVAPGFEFADFSMPSRQALGEQFPSHRPLIERFTRS